MRMNDYDDHLIDTNAFCAVKKETTPVYCEEDQGRLVLIGKENTSNFKLSYDSIKLRDEDYETLATIFDKRDPACI